MAKIFYEVRDAITYANNTCLKKKRSYIVVDAPFYGFVVLKKTKKMNKGIIYTAHYQKPEKIPRIRFLSYFTFTK